MILGIDSTLPINFLEKAIKCSRAVGRIVRTLPDRGPAGTGFVILDEYVMTCHHVIADSNAAKTASFQLDYFIKDDGTFNQIQELKLNPSKFFATNETLDVTVVALAENPEVDFGERSISNLQIASLMNGENINIIHHILGEPQRISMRDGQVVVFSDDLIRHTSPTRAGSAGAPIFNDQWELIGLHHSSGS